MLAFPSLPDASLPEKALLGAYYAQHEAIRLSLIGAHRGLALFAKRRQPPSAAVVRSVRERYRSLLRREAENVRAGYYPLSLCFSLPFGQYARHLPRLALDLPRILLRRSRRDFRDLPQDVDLSRFPTYYRQNFHWQTDGYLSARSASLYDVGVEFLFVGCADVMRRQVIPPLARFGASQRRPLRVLDVGCGTGRTLLQLARALPENHYRGIDLSPHYISQARSVLAGCSNVEVARANAETLPFGDAEFDAVVSVFLFHELPRAVRRGVLGEIRRVLRPGGLLVVEDSAQASDAPDIGGVLDDFAADMHEPYYEDYVRDDLASLLEECGFAAGNVERCFVAKVVESERP